MHASTKSTATAPRRGRSFVRVLAVVAITTLAASVIAELVLRRWYPVDSLYFELDARRIYRPLPGARNLFVPIPGSGARRTLWEFNDQGFRGPDVGPKVAERLRIGVYGDSFVAACETPLEQTFVVGLEREIARRGRAVECVNAGVTGYGPDQSILRIEEELPSLAPDVVVLAICVQNDLNDVARNALFRLEADGSLVEAHPPPSEAYARRYEAWRARAARPVLVRLYERWRASGNASTDSDESTPAIATGEIAAWRAGCAALARAQESAEPAAGADTTAEADARARLALMEKLFERLRADCEKRNVRAVVMVIPCTLDFLDDRELAPDGSAISRDERHVASRAFASLAERAGLPVLDLFDAFYDGGGRALYLAGSETHWNPTGQRVAAERFSAFLAEHALL